MAVQQQAQRLVDHLASLIKSSPCRTCPDVGWDGTTKGYVQRPVSAAPASDARTKLQLASVPHDISKCRDARSGIDQTTTVDEALQQLLHLLCGSTGQQLARALHNADISIQLTALCSFATPSTVLLTEQMYGRLALSCSAFKEEQLQKGSIHGLLGLLLYAGSSTARSGDTSHSGNGNDDSSRTPCLGYGDGGSCDAQDTRAAPSAVASAVQLAALERFTGALDAASGAEILHFVGKGDGLAAAAGVLLQACAMKSTASAARDQDKPLAPATALLAGEDAAKDAAIVKASKQVFLGCLQRSRRMKGLAPHQVPRMGYWARLSPKQVLQLEQAALSGPPKITAGGAECCTASPMGAGSTKVGECIGDSHRSTLQASGTGGMPLGRQEYDEDGIRLVWDNAPNEEVQAARNAWKDMPLSDKISWTQTASELDVRVLLPAGTRKRDLSVAVTPERLTVSLGWHGRFLDGPLAGRIKHSSALWVIEAASNPAKAATATRAAGKGAAHGASSSGAGGGSAGCASSTADCWPRLQLLLPKDDAGHYWRSLFEGGEEKSHWQILQEAVQCSDADANDTAAGGTASADVQRQAALLVQQLRERQALVASGALDLENGFDDFRIVLGDAGL